MRWLLLFVTLLLPACGSAPAPRATHGDSLAGALVLRGGAGGPDPQIAEYDWIRENRPGARLVGEGRLRQAGRVYDVVRIVRRGRPEQLYFDVTAAIDG